MNALTQADGVGEDAIERPQLNVDIACVGFGPAMGGFLTTLVRGLEQEPESDAFASAASPDLGARRATSA